jgi:hypothetical protein
MGSTMKLKKKDLSATPIVLLFLALGAFATGCGNDGFFGTAGGGIIVEWIEEGAQNN